MLAAIFLWRIRATTTVRWNGPVFDAHRVIGDVPHRYNAAPTQVTPVIIGHEQDERLVADSAAFGWKRKFLSGGMVINARAETVQTRPMFRAAFKAKRCVIPANGFFEWEKSGKQRLPWYFTSTAHAMFGLAGLYDPATDAQPAGFVILTTAPNELVAPYHNRMPVMLAPGDAKAFIQGTPEAAAAMLQTYSAGAMKAHRVSPAMNRAGHDGAECITAI